MAHLIISPRNFRYHANGSKMPIGSSRSKKFFNERSDSRSPVSTPTSDIKDAQAKYDEGLLCACVGDFDKATADWFEASEYGHVGAQKKLALAYLCGMGVSSASDDEATYFFQRASTQV
jgi:TPR repeat protein